MLRIFFTAVLLAVLPLLNYAQQKQAAADLILINGRIWTGDDLKPFTEAIAIKGKFILKTGTNAEIKKLAGSKTQIIDLKGKMVSPGFNDAHSHFLSGSLGLSQIDLNNCKTPGAALAIIDSFAKANPHAQWITGLGWQYTIFENGLPTKELLDKIIPDRPVYLKAYDGHSAWVNSKALALAGVTNQTVYNGFGEVVKNNDGNPTGALKEGAQQLVAKLIPQPSKEDKLKALRQGMKYAASLGITSVQNASGSAEELQLYMELLQNGELTIRYAAAFSANKNTSDSAINQFIQYKNKWTNHPMLRASSVKFMLDGVIESHTAVMIEPYSDTTYGKSNGDFALPVETYRRLVTIFDKAGFQIYTHAIGDASVREALNAYEQAQLANKTTNKRHRIEHIEQCQPQDVLRFAKLNVLASMEPIHADPGTIAVWEKAVGTKRLPHSFMWASMLANKVKLVFSSDWPACINPDPIHGLHIAVNRKTIDGQPPAGWVPQQKINMKDALSAYTAAGAYSSFEENFKGKIKAGYLADVIVLSQNLFEIPEADIYKTKVLMTIFNGKIIYSKEEKQGF